MEDEAKAVTEDVPKKEAEEAPLTEPETPQTVPEVPQTVPEAPKPVMEDKGHGSGCCCGCGGKHGKWILYGLVAMIAIYIIVRILF